jgi:hypothetical protein
MSYNPLTIEYTYKKEASGNYYVGYANDIYLTQKFVRNIYLTIGSKDEKNEFLASVLAIFWPSPWKLQFRYKYSILENGKNNLFQNISVSPFLGGSLTSYNYHSITDHVFYHGDNSYMQMYAGAAVGTRKTVIDKFSYIEIFASPQISYTLHSGLGGGEDLNPVTYLSDRSKTSSAFAAKVLDFNIPIGIGFKYRYFFIKSGISITTTLVGEERWRKGGKLTVNSYNLPKIPIFMECGVHFRKFKQLEREMSN